MENFTLSVREIMKRKGLSDEEAAGRMHISGGEFSALLSDGTEVGEAEIVALAGALEVSFNELFGVCV